MSLISSNRTPAQCQLFVKAWVTAQSMHEVSATLRASGYGWPFSTNLQALNVFAEKLRRAGVELPRRTCRHAINASDLNTLIGDGATAPR